MVGFIPKAANAAQGLLGRIAQLPESPAFAAGIGFLQGNPQAGISQANQIRQAQVALQQQQAAQEQAMQQAKAAAAQRQFDNALAERRTNIAEQQLTPDLIRTARALYPNDEARQKAFIEAKNHRNMSGVTGQPIAARTKDGENVFLQQMEDGSIRRVEGYEPLNASLLSLTNPELAARKSFEEGKGRETGKNEADAVEELYSGAIDALETKKRLSEGRSLLDQGVISGAGADWRLGASRVLSTVTGIPMSDQQNTDEYIALTGKLVAQTITDFGAGTGLSDADREYARKIAGGELAISKDGLKRILDLADRVQDGRIGKYNRRRAPFVEGNDVYTRIYPEIGAGAPAAAGARQVGEDLFPGFNTLSPEEQKRARELMGLK